MNKREQIATMAMQALIDNKKNLHIDEARRIAIEAVRMADALLTRLKEHEEDRMV
jgi:hypothetical protein